MDNLSKKINADSGVHSENNEHTSSLSFNSKSLARIMAVQSVYYVYSSDLISELDLVFNNVKYIFSSKEIMREIFEIDFDFDYKVNYGYAKSIFENVIHKENEIEELISCYLDGTRTVKKMNLMLASVVKAGVSEMIKFPNVPYKVVIKEYTDIAKEFSIPPNELKFVNSILDKVAKKLNA